MAACLKSLAGVGDGGAVHLEDGKILISVIANIEVAAIRRERDALRKGADLYRADWGHVIALDAQHGDAAIWMVEPLALDVRTISTFRAAVTLPLG